MLRFFLQFGWFVALLFALCIWAVLQVVAVRTRFRHPLLNRSLLALNCTCLVGAALATVLWAFVNIAAQEEGTAGTHEPRSDLAWTLPPLLIILLLSAGLVVNCIGMARRRA